MKTTHWEKSKSDGLHCLYVGDLLTGFRVSEAVSFDDEEHQKQEHWIDKGWTAAPQDDDPRLFLAISPYEDTKTVYATLSAAQAHCESMYELFVDLGIAELHAPYEGFPGGIPDEWLE
jgi:hypothetical protein